MSKVNDMVREQIEGLMLNVEDLDHYRDIDFLRNSSYGKEFALNNQLNPNYLPDKLKSDKLLVAKLKSATEEHPEQMEEVFSLAKKLRKGIDKMGIREWLMAGKRSPWQFALFALGMLALLPLFVATIAPTWLVFVAPILVNRLAIRDRQFWGSINLAVTLLVTYPLCGIVPTIVLLSCGLWEIALGYFLLFLPAVIFSSLYMHWAKKALGYFRLLTAEKRNLFVLYGTRTKLYKKLDEVLK
jgi:hypothetical protein